MLKSTQKNSFLSKNLKNKRFVYLDNASATPIDKKVFSKMKIFFEKNYANPSSLHDLGIQNREILEEQRKIIATILEVQKNEIIFTSGSTESNNLAILGILENFSGSFMPHLITSNIEHASVLEIFKYLEKKGKAEVSYLAVEKNGLVNIDKLKKEIKKNTILISIIYANGEIGTIQPIREISKEIRFFKKKNNNSIYPLFHTDATQAVNYLPIRVEKLGVDLLSFNASKIYGPKSIGVLFCKKEIPISKIFHGGNQENNLRPGTENLANIVGLTEALKISEKLKDREAKRLLKLRNYFLSELFKIIPALRVNGDLNNRLPNNLNISIPKIPSDLLLVELSARSIFVSEKSACKSGDKSGSSVIKALYNSSSSEINNSLRFSLGRETKKEDLDYVIFSLKLILEKLKTWYF
jgi:cysteine desulfurase